jgi:dihydroxy-acid dehydratase
VGILSTASDFNPCHKTAPQVAEAISRGVRMAGALPFVFPTVSLHEAFSFRPRCCCENLMAMDVEEMISALPLDAVVLIGGCDKTIPAELMGAISADMPAIIVNVGSMLAGKHEGTRLGACTDCRRLWAQFRAGTLDGPDLNRAHDQLMPTSGTCMVMGTASTMACMAETLGFMLPGSATAPAVSSGPLALRRSDRQARRRDGQDRRPEPSELLTKAALRNASVVLQATSGSTNALVHLAAIAGRAGITYDLQELDRVGREVPVLLDLKPAGMNFMEDFHSGGSLPSLWRRLKDHLDLNAKTVNGETIGEIIARWPAYVDDKVIRPLDNPLVKSEAIAILTGNLAPGGAGDQARLRDTGAVPARGPGAGVRIARGPGKAHRRSESQRHAADRDGAAQRRTDRRARHARSGRAADPEEARLEGPEGHGAALGCAHERHRVRHGGAACVAGGRRRRAAGAGS